MQVTSGSGRIDLLEFTPPADGDKESSPQIKEPEKPREPQLEQAHQKLPNLNEKGTEHQPSNKLKLDLQQNQEETHIPSTFTTGPP